MKQLLQGICIAGALLLAAPSTSPVTAQDLPAPGAAVRTGAVLTIDSERMFLNSAFGMRVAREIEARGNVLALENRQIEASLAEAEQELTNMRPTMTPEQFRPLADRFDARVQETRQAQAAKSRALNALLDQEREVFLGAAGPVLEELMLQSGASVVMERRTVFISINSSDITAAAIARLNATLGEGTSVAPVAPAPAAQDPDTQAPDAQAPENPD
jgi:Skp family chaperone for outer membrane proteins